MKRSLSINCERAPQPANDPLEQQTWAAIRIYAANRCVTRWLERKSQEELDTIYVPAFPLARWVIMNWWALLNEPSPEENPPAPHAPWTIREQMWLQRHCLRSAESGLFLPRLTLWNNGKKLVANWIPDPEDSYPTMPGSFLYGSTVAIDSQAAEDTFRAFVTTVLRWVENVDDPRANRLRANWEAITNVSADEAAFCRAAGRMGLDPYCTADWPKGLVELLEALGDNNPSPLVTDFLSAAAPDEAAALWNWVDRARQTGDLGPAPVPPPLPLNIEVPPGQAGVMAAQRLRKKMGFHDAEVPQVKEVADRLGLGHLLYENYNHQPGASIRAAVGWENGKRAIIRGPQPESLESQRFLLARGLFHAVFLCERGARLVTRTHDWDQQASRGFAAELLAPRASLVAAVPAELDDDERAEAILGLARKYQVHTELIRRQLQNASRFGA